MTDYSRLFAYLDELSRNNNREWFADHRAEYDELRAGWVADVDMIIRHMALHDPSLRGVEAKQCLYRIYRDTRFSPDKTPYKTYFSALISPVGRHCDRACYYFHVGAGESLTGGGLWCPESKVLKKIRRAIVDNIEEFRGIIDAPELVTDYPQWDGPWLKTAPKGYDRDHPDIDLLRLTSYSREHLLSRDFFSHDGWQEEAARLLLVLKPLNDFINYSIDE